MISRLFKAHPQSVGESYVEHLAHASYFGFRMVFAGCACLIHALLPFLFEKTGSKAITNLHNRMVTNRCKDGAKPSQVIDRAA